MKHEESLRYKKRKKGKKGRLVIQGSTLSFNGRTHQGESAWKANQCLLMIWVNCFEDGWTSVLICRPLQSPWVEVLYSRVLCPCCEIQIRHFCFE